MVNKVKLVSLFLYFFCFDLFAKDINLRDFVEKREDGAFFVIERGSFFIDEDVAGEGVCAGVLNALNQAREYRFNDAPGASSESWGGLVNFGFPEMVIQTDLNVPRVLVRDTRQQGARDEQFVVDLDKDGVDEVIYRSIGSLSGVWVSDFYILPLVYDSSVYSRFGKFMMDQRSSGGVSEFYFAWKSFYELKIYEFLREVASQKMVEFIEYEGGYYMLFVKSMFKDRKPIRIALVKLGGDGRGLYPACLFESNFKLLIY